ncbi:MAG TPA: endo-1,4-beta-xylanase [Spirochaetia bacterium]|nr:endo-1,4-beta-xylanase [Spirochaetia bacterium]
MQSLASLYEPYFPVGAAVEPQTLMSQGNLLASQVNSLVAENAMKWERIHPRPGKDPSAYDFGGADAIVEFARAHGMKVRGHTLVWHNQVPGWVFQAAAGQGGLAGQASKSEVLERMREHISTLLAHFRGGVYCWDVVNEAVTDAGEWRTDSPWFRTAGSDDDAEGIPDYVVKAFEYARAADPDVRLFYNDYSIEGGAKLEKVVVLVKALKGKGLVDGVGIQGHWTLFGPAPELVRSAIERLAALDVEVQVTELDLSVYRPGDSSSLPELSPGLASEQAARYGSYFKVFRDASTTRAFTGVTFWGIADDHTWLDSFPVKGRKDWPLLFDTHHRPKSAFWTVAQW